MMKEKTSIFLSFIFLSLLLFNPIPLLFENNSVPALVYSNTCVDGQNTDHANQNAL